MTNKKQAIPRHAIRWLVGNQHVSASNLTIARLIWNRSRSWKRSARRAAIRYALLTHHDNRKLYASVMRGL